MGGGGSPGQRARAVGCLLLTMHSAAQSSLRKWVDLGGWLRGLRMVSQLHPSPLASVAVRRALENSTLEKASAAWSQANAFITGPLDEFPDTVHQEEPCKLGECLHGLRPEQEHRLNSISQELRLALRHSGLPANAPLCCSLVCGVEVKYCIIGDHDWTHSLRCDAIL